MDTKLTHEEIVTLTNDALAKMSDWLECNIPDLTGLGNGTHIILDQHVISELRYSNCCYSVKLNIEDEKPSIEIKYASSALSNIDPTVEIHINEDNFSYDDPYVSVFKALSITAECWDAITKKITGIITNERISIENQINELPNCISSLIKFTD